MAYTGGYTSAINDAQGRQTQAAQLQAYLQQLAQQKILFQQQQEAQQRQRSAREQLGGMLPQLVSPPPGGPQSPPPGQASVPMASPQQGQPAPPAQPQGPPGMALPPPPGAGAPPMPQQNGPPAAPGAPPARAPAPAGGMPPPAAPGGWQALPKPPQGMAEPGGIPAPPEDAVMPKKVVSVSDMVKLLDAKGIKGEAALDMLDQWKPYMDTENKQQLDTMKVQNAALAAANKAYVAKLKEAEQERHNRTMEGQGEKRLGQGQQRININVNGAGETDLAKDSETRRFMAEQYWAGDNSVMQNLGRGAQGAKNITALRKEIVAVGKEQGKTPKDLAAAQAEFQGMKSGERTLGTRTANIEMAATEAASLADLAKAASEKVARTEFKSLNDVIQAAQKKTSSPELRAFVASNTSLINAYARAINPQGVGTVADKEHAREMLDTGFSKGDYAATVDQLLKEIDAAKKSPGQVKDSMRKGFTGRGGEGDYVELRTTSDGRTLGKKADGSIEVVK